MCHPVPSSPTTRPDAWDTRPNDTVDAVRTRIVVNSASAPEAARPSTGMKPKKGHRPLVQIGVVATVVMARVSSSGGAARNVDADGTRPKRPPQTNASTSGFLAAQESSGRADKRWRRRGGRRGCTNASTLILHHTRGPQIIIRFQERHWCKRFGSAIGMQPSAGAGRVAVWHCSVALHTGQAMKPYRCTDVSVH